MTYTEEPARITRDELEEWAEETWCGGKWDDCREHGILAPVAAEALLLLEERDAARAELAAAKARVFAIIGAAEADVRAAVVRSERRLRE